MKTKILVTGLIALAIVSLFTFSSMPSSADNKAVVLSKDNTIVLNSEVNGENTAKVISKAKELDNTKGRAPLYLVMNSPGGSIQSGLEMIEALRGLDHKINTITIFSASMAFQIVENLGERLILKNGVMMSHRAKGQFEGEFGGTFPSQIDSRYHFWLSRLKEMDEQTVVRTNGKQTLESYQKAYGSELWMTGTESVQNGYSDRVVLVKCDSSLAGTTKQTSTFLIFTVTYELDNCPLNTSPMNINAFLRDGVTPVPPEKLEEIKSSFLEQYLKKQRMVVPMSIVIPNGPSSL